MLESFFAPRGVAVIGASRDERKLSFGLLRNLVEHGFPGAIYPVNRKADSILGLRCYPDVTSVPDPVDLAIIIIPAALVPGALDLCGQRGIKVVVVIAGGFSEVGPEGARREAQLVDIARRYGMRLLGPNCVGVIDTGTPLNATFIAGMPLPGHIAFLSQSGAVCGGLIDWTRGQGVGFSRFVSLGNQADLTETDFLEFFGRDSRSRVIAAYIEGIDDGRRFVQVARQVSRAKPVVVVKVGITQGGTRAVISHTGSLAGSERAYEAAFRQSGVLRADSVEALFDYAQAFASQPLPGGDGFAIVTNAGGPGALASDAGEAAGLRLVEFSPETIATLAAHFPPEARLTNPVDMLGSGTATDYAVALEAVLADPNVDGVVVIHVPHALVRAEEVAEIVGARAARRAKPVLACFMGDVSIRPALAILRHHGIPCYTFPEPAAKALAAMARYRRWRDRPELPPAELPVLDRECVRFILDRARSMGRLNLSELEAREVLQAYGIPVVRAGLVTTAEEAVRLAETLGFPVALKIASPDILHKTEVGGVRLGLKSPTDVTRAFAEIVDQVRWSRPGVTIWGVTVQQMVAGGHEIIVGMNRDPQFGPLVMFGLGGVYVEALGDVSFRLAPFDMSEAEAMIAETRACKLLRGYRGAPPADLTAIADCLVRVSQLAIDFPNIQELDINPLLVRTVGQGAVAVDARLVLGEASMANQQEGVHHGSYSRLCRDGNGSRLAGSEPVSGQPG